MEQGYIAVTAEALLAQTISLGGDSIRVHNGELVAYNNGFYTPYFNSLTSLAQQMLSPDWFAWLKV
jgi:hypothetical protein